VFYSVLKTGFFEEDTQNLLGEMDTPKGESAGEFYVRTLSTSIHKTGWNISVDNWFTSVASFDEMLKINGCTMVRTSRKNKREWPPEFLKPHTEGNFAMRLR